MKKKKNYFAALLVAAVMVFTLNCIPMFCATIGYDQWEANALKKWASEDYTEDQVMDMYNYATKKVNRGMDSEQAVAEAEAMIKGNSKPASTPATVEETKPAESETPKVEETQQKEETPAKKEEVKVEETKEEDKKEETHVHEYKQEITKQPTCTEKGELTYTCECGDSYTEEISSLGHEFEEISRTEPTCTEDGTILYKCTRCDYNFEESISKLGHAESEWTTVKEPGLFAKGEQQKLCTVCGAVLDTQELPQTFQFEYWMLMALGGVFIVAGIVLVFIKSKKNKNENDK